MTGRMVVERRAPRKRTRTQIVFSILSSLHRHAGLRRTELAQCVSLNGAHIARWMYRMTALHIVEERGPGLYLTEKGERALAVLLEYYQIMGVDIRRVLGDQRLDTAEAWPREPMEAAPQPGAPTLLT